MENKKHGAFYGNYPGVHEYLRRIDPSLWVRYAACYAARTEHVAASDLHARAMRELREEKRPDFEEAFQRSRW